MVSSHTGGGVILKVVSIILVMVVVAIGELGCGLDGGTKALEPALVKVRVSESFALGFYSVEWQAGTKGGVVNGQSLVVISDALPPVKVKIRIDTAALTRLQQMRAADCARRGLAGQAICVLPKYSVTGYLSVNDEIVDSGLSMKANW